MRKLVVLLSSSMLLLFACTENNEQKAEEVENIIEETIFDPTDTSSIKEGPQVVFEQEVFDFGTITQGDSVKFAFKFTNTGDAPLIIKSTSAGCGCTIPKTPADPIGPGEQGEIPVIFNSKGKRGKISKDVNVLTTAREKPYIVKLKGEVLVEEEQ